MTKSWERSDICIQSFLERFLSAVNQPTANVMSNVTTSVFSLTFYGEKLDCEKR